MQSCLLIGVTFDHNFPQHAIHEKGEVFRFGPLQCCEKVAVYMKPWKDVTLALLIINTYGLEPGRA